MPVCGELLEARALLSATTFGLDAIYERAPGDDDFMPPHDGELHAPGDEHDPGNSGFQFNLDSRWFTTATNGSGLTQGQPTTLTWSFIADGTPISGGVGEPASNSSLIAFLDTIYGNVTNDTNYTDELWFVPFESYLNRWGELSGLTYVYEPNDDGANFVRSPGVLGVRGDLRIGGHSIDGQSGSNTLAYNYYPNTGDMVIDTDNTSFYGNTSGNSIRLRNVLAHEHGHGIGIQHVCPLLGGADGRLMEPFISTAFDGPQFDDILAAQRAYGDALEKNGGNDTFGTTTALGFLTPGTPVERGTDADNAQVIPSESDFISIDDNSDTDFFSFSVAAGVTVSITLIPQGPTYLSGPQNANGSCSAGTPFDSSAQSDLTLALLDSNGSTVLELSDVSGAGGNEVVVSDPLPAGTYYARVTGADNAAQFYEISITGTLAPPLLVTEVKLSGSTWNGNFRDTADDEILGSGVGQGFSIPTGGPAQTLPSSWSRINRLIVTFSEPVDEASLVANGNVVVHGIDSTPNISLITVDGNQMFIDLASNLPTDALRLEIQDTVMSTAGEPLDGDFANNSSTLPSGGSAGVGDPVNNFNFQFVTNPGDANRSGTVNISDAVIIFQNFFAAAGSAGYTIFADMTGDGILNISDAVVVFQNFFASPPAFPPPLFEPGSGFASAPPVVSPGNDRPLTPAPSSPSGRSGSSAPGQSAPYDSPSAPASSGQQPDAELEVLDEVLTDSVGDVLFT